MSDIIQYPMNRVFIVLSMCSSHGTVESTQFAKGTQKPNAITLFARGDALQLKNTLVLFLFKSH